MECLVPPLGTPGNLAVQTKGLPERAYTDGETMNWQTATIDDINAYCAKCGPAWDEFNCPRCNGTGGYRDSFDPQDDDDCPHCGGDGINPDNPPYLTMLDGREVMTEYGDLLVQRAIEKNCKAFSSSMCRLLDIVAHLEDGDEETMACATPRQRLHAACEVLGEQRKEE